MVIPRDELTGNGRGQQSCHTTNSRIHLCFSPIHPLDGDELPRDCAAISRISYQLSPYPGCNPCGDSSCFFFLLLLPLSTRNEGAGGGYSPLALHAANGS